MKICDNGVIREMTAEELAELEARPYEPVRYGETEAIASAVRLMMNGKTPQTDDERIVCAALYPEWSAGAHAQGEVYTVQGEVWECFQSYDNAVYPDVSPTGSAWRTFNRPLHGTSPETARPWAAPTGAHDMYHAGEHMIYSGKLYRCASDTAYSPADYAAAWVAV